MQAHAELSEDGGRIEVFSRRWSDGSGEAMKSLAGATYYSRKNERSKYPGTAYWTMPLDVTSGRELRAAFGDGLTLGPRLTAWGRRAVRRERNLGTIAQATTAKLKRLPTSLPRLYEAIHLGPVGRWMTEEERTKALAGEPSFQAADVKFLATADNPLNGNQPGLGKTIEWIAAVYEAGLEDGRHLIVAQRSALDTVWREELERWQPLPVVVSTGTKVQKQRAIAEFMKLDRGWLVVNADQLRFRETFDPCEWHDDVLFRDARWKKEVRECPNCESGLVSEFPELHSTVWNSEAIDEAHKAAIRRGGSLTAKGLKAVKVKPGGKRTLLTGTPMGGNILNLWGLLNFLNPKVFSSKWRFAEQWIDIGTVSFWKRGADGVAKEHKKKVMGKSLKHCAEHFGHDDESDGRPDCHLCNEIEEAFGRMLSTYLVRRTKAEVLPWLPPKQRVDVWCGFGSLRHRKQYEDFSRQSETVISGETITRIGVLDEYMRLRQFAGFRHEYDRARSKLVPTEDSGKLDALRDKLDELGIWDGTSDEQAVIFSQFSEVVDLVHSWLNRNGVPTARLTGATNKRGERDAIQREFQSSRSIRCLVMTTTAGGVSINLDRANSVHILDETWDPDDQEQAEDRCHRASRIHQVTVYYYRTEATMDEYLFSTTGNKSLRNMRVLDLRRILRSKPSRERERGTA